MPLIASWRCSGPYWDFCSEIVASLMFDMSPDLTGMKQKLWDQITLYIFTDLEAFYCSSV